MSRRSFDRRRSDALQHALKRCERALTEGADPSETASKIASELGPERRMFLLAARLREAAVPVPQPEFAEAFAAKLRTAEIVRKPHVVVLRHRMRVAPLAIAACIALFAALLLPSLSSVPGDPLYAVKGFSEDVRVWFASGPAEARVRLDLATERFEEVEKLVEGSRLLALASGPGVLAAPSLERIEDPQIVGLIETALAEAGAHIETAADILISHPVPAHDLDALVAITHRGRELVSKVADELPHGTNPPVLSTGVKLAKIEAKAKAARMKVDAEPALQPCSTPTPAPQATVTPAADSQPPAQEPQQPQETATPEPTASPTPSPTPEPTPCLTPSPSPTPQPTPEPQTTDAPLDEKTPPPGGQEGVNSSSGEQQGGVSSDQGADRAHAGPGSDA